MHLGDAPLFPEAPEANEGNDIQAKFAVRQRQAQWHQGRRRALHQQVLSEYITARQHKQQQWAQQAGIQQEEG